MGKYRVGILGYGGFGQFLHHSWRRLENAQIVAVAGRSHRPDPPVHFYNKWDDLITDSEVDILSIATPPSFHASNAIAAMESGKHVLIEKPLATTIEDARRIMTVHKRTGRVAAINFIQRFNPLVDELVALTRKKILGELRRVDVENYAQDEGLPREHWLWNKKISGGILIEHSVHFIDLVNSLTDQKPIRVTGSRFRRNDVQEDQVMANVVYNRGLMATFYNSFSRPGYLEYTSLHLVFDLGQIDLEGWIPIKGKLKALVNSETKEYLEKLPGFTILNSLSVQKIRDTSRMKGWGEPEIFIPAHFRDRIRSGGIEYEVEEMITAQIKVGKSKQTVYENCVCFSLQNLICKIENPSNVLRAPLEAGLLSLEIACKADRFDKCDY